MVSSMNSLIEFGAVIIIRRLPIIVPLACPRITLTISLISQPPEEEIFDRQLGAHTRIVIREARVARSPCAGCEIHKVSHTRDLK